MSKLIYLSGAMGCYVKTNDDYPYKWRKDAKEWFEKYTQFKTFSPHDYYDYKIPSHITEKEIMRYEFNVLKNSDIVLVNLKDLDKSIGTSDELLFAYLKGIPIVGFYSEIKSNSELQKAVHPWKLEQIDRIEIGNMALNNALMYINEYYGDD